MIHQCPQCGKEFDVLWPQLWSYKRGQKFLCTYTCLRAYDEGKEANEMGKITKENKEKAINIALEGGDPRPYLKECGSIAPDKLWSYIKMQLKKNEPEFYEKLAKGAGAKKQVETPEIGGHLHNINRTPPPPPKPIRIETPEKPGKVFRPYPVTGIRTDYGEFYYDRKFNSLDWRTEEGDEVSMSPVAWKNMADELPDILAALGVGV